MNLFINSFFQILARDIATHGLMEYERGIQDEHYRLLRKDLPLDCDAIHKEVENREPIILEHLKRLYYEWKTDSSQMDKTEDADSKRVGDDLARFAGRITGLRMEILRDIDAANNGNT